jgi:GTP-binding protein
LANKTQVVVVNKIDIPEVREKLPSLIQELRKISGHTRILGISAATRENTKELINRVNKLVNSLPAQSSYELFMEEEKRVNFLEMDTVDTSTGDGSGRDFEIIPMNENESEDGITQRVGVENSGLVKHKAFKVVGKKIEKLVKMTNWDYYEAVTRFQRILDAQGITAALEEAGAKQGDMIVIGDWQFQYWDKKNRWVADLGIEEIISPRERYVSDADNDENENNL